MKEPLNTEGIDIYAEFLALNAKINRGGKLFLAGCIMEFLHLVEKIHEDVERRGAWMPTNQAPTCSCGIRGFHNFKVYHYTQVISLIQCKSCGAFYMPKVADQPAERE